MDIKELINGFNKLFDEEIYLDDEDVIPESERLLYSSRDNVCGIIPYKKSVKNNLINNFEVEGGIIPPLDFKTSYDQEIKCRYPMEYLAIILKMTKRYEELTFYMAPDYPLKIECKDFAFLIAPRISY